MADYSNFQPTDEWAKSNTGMSLADFYKSNPSYQSRSSSGNNTAAYDDLLKSLPKTSDMVTSINANENNAFGDYMKYLTSQKSPLDTYNQISNEQGIPQLRKTQSSLQGQIYNLEDTLRRIEPNVAATTGNSIVTEAQRQGIVTEKSKPIVENLGWIGQSLGRVSSAISEANQQALTLTDLTQQGTQQFVDAYKTKLNLVSQQGDRALQAFINDNDKILEVTLAKLHRGEQISDQEAQNAFELQKMQKQAELTIQANASNPQTQIIEADGRKYLINTQTGQRISDLGSSKSSSGGTSSSFSMPTATPTSAKPTSSPSSSGINPQLYNYLFGGTTVAGNSATVKK